jgi:hypothetical protein
LIVGAGHFHFAIAFRPAAVIVIQIVDFSRPSRAVSVARIVAFARSVARPGDRDPSSTFSRHFDLPLSLNCPDSSVDFFQ